VVESSDCRGQRASDGSASSSSTSLNDYHDSGAGSWLLNGVTNPDESVGLWVAGRDPLEFQAFYRKHKFHPDGKQRSDNGIDDLHPIRGPDR
jgi:hypothetical protein